MRRRAGLIEVRRSLSVSKAGIARLSGGSRGHRGRTDLQRSECEVRLGGEAEGEQSRAEQSKAERGRAALEPRGTLGCEGAALVDVLAQFCDRRRHVRALVGRQGVQDARVHGTDPAVLELHR